MKQHSRRGHPARRGGVVLVGIGVALALVALFGPSSDAQGSSVVINELQPRNSSTIADGDGDFEDWVELRNTTGSPIDLTGWRIEDTAAQWPFPSGTTIPANGFLLVWASDKGVPTDPDFPGPPGQLHANFQLNGTTETVTLVDDFFAVVDTVSYDRAFAQDESFGRDGGGDFVVFTPVDVTPGAANGAVSTPTPTPSPTPTAPPAPASIVFNEVMASNSATIADGDGDFEDWFELFNPTCDVVSLDGWAVRDTDDEWPLPGGLVLQAGDTLLLWASNKGDPTNVDEFPGPAGELHTSFRLSADGEELFLLDEAGGLVDTVNPGLSLSDESFARTGTGAFVTRTGADVTPANLNPTQSAPVCTPTPTPTPGGPTVTATPAPEPTSTPSPVSTPVPTATSTPEPIACATQVVINEIQSRNDSTIEDGEGDFSDWIELYNPGSVAVDLRGWTIADSANTFVLAPGTSIGADGYLLIWASDKGDPTDPDFPGPEGEVHANFRVTGDGEATTLSDVTGCVIDQVEVPELDDDESYGVLPTGGLGRFRPGFATPGAPNGAQALPQRTLCFAPESPVILNRVVSRNDGLLEDGDGDDADFIELLNTGLTPVDIGLWQISDESDRSILPGDTVVGPGETLILWASGKGDVLDEDYPGPGGEIHLTFRLAGDGEQLTFAEPSECIVDQFSYPELQPNEAYGFDAQGQRVVLAAPEVVALPEGGGSADGACPAGEVAIIAVSARNDAGRADEDGDFGDWFELQNTTQSPVDLSGWTFADDSTAWAVPDGVMIDSGGLLLVWADDKDRGGPDATLHTNFALAGGGETITVASSPDCVVASLTYPELDDDQVYRLSADGSFAVQGAGPIVDDEDADSEAGDLDDADANAEESDGDETDVVVTASAGCIAITEFMAGNDSTLADAAGEFGDWIELVNLSEESIDLEGYTLADSEDEWVFPTGVELDVDQVLIVWADGEDRVDELDDGSVELHTDFRLSGGGEPITLRTPEGTVEAGFSGYPELDDDESFGIGDDGGLELFTAGESTPGEAPDLDGCDPEITDAEDTDAEITDAEDTAGAETGASADEPLARTGSPVSVQSLLIQVFLISGVTLVVMAGIARRRAH